MSLLSIWRLLHSLEHRAFLLFEHQRLSRLGASLPDDSRARIVKNPSRDEDFIHIKAFCHDIEPSRIRLVDVGANVGDFIENFDAYFPSAKYMAFEPDPRNVAVLKQRFASNPNVRIFDCALSDHEKECNLFLSDNTAYSSLEKYNDVENAFRINSSGQTQTVRAARFDEFALELDSTFNILKIDVQGHEVECLTGFGKTLSQFSIVLIESTFADEYVEKSPSFPDLCAIMKAHDLYPIVFQRFGRFHNSYGYERDVLFVRRELLKRAYW